MEKPQSIADLCQLLEAPLHLVSIPCLCCLQNLSNEDKILFDWKQFQLIWKGVNVYGACSGCVEEICFIDYLLNYETSVDAFLVAVNLGDFYFNLPLRCVRCAKWLTDEEKNDVLVRGDNIYSIKGRWKAFCIVCALLN